MTLLLLSQVFGLFGFLLGFLGIQKATSKDFFIYTAIANCMWVFHHFLIFNKVAALVCLVASLRAISCVFLGRYYQSLVIVISIMFFITIFLINSPSWISFIPTFGAVVYSASMFYSTKVVILRVGCFVCALCWLANGIIYNSPVEIFATILTIISILWGVIWHDLEIGKVFSCRNRRK